MMERRPDVNMDMKTLAIWTKTDPNTCLEASKNQILTGLWGLSFHLLYTSESRARPPRAAWTSRANDPSRRHSPVFSVGLPSAMEAASWTADIVFTAGGDERVEANVATASIAAATVVDSGSCCAGVATGGTGGGSISPVEGARV